MKTDRLSEIVLATEAAAEDTRDANYIRYTVTTGRASVVLQTHVNGEDGQWITYDRTQLDELIKVLQSVRDELL